MDNEQKQKMLEQQRAQAALLDAQQPDEDSDIDDESEEDASPEDQLASDQQQSRIANSEDAPDPSNESEGETDAPEGEDRVSDIKKQKLEERKKKEDEAKKKKEEETKKQGGQEETGDMAEMLDRAMSTGPALPYWINVKLGMSLWNYIFFRKQDAKSPFFPIIRPLQWKNINPSLALGVPLPNFVLHIIVLTIDFFYILWNLLLFLTTILVAAAPYLIAAGAVGAAAYGISQVF